MQIEIVLRILINAQIFIEKNQKIDITILIKISRSGRTENIQFVYSQFGANVLYILYFMRDKCIHVFKNNNFTLVEQK